MFIYIEFGIKFWYKPKIFILSAFVEGPGGMALLIPS